MTLLCYICRPCMSVPFFFLKVDSTYWQCLTNTAFAPPFYIELKYISRNFTPDWIVCFLPSLLVPWGQGWGLILVYTEALKSEKMLNAHWMRSLNLSLKPILNISPLSPSLPLQDSEFLSLQQAEHAIYRLSRRGCVSSAAKPEMGVGIFLTQSPRLCKCCISLTQVEKSYPPYVLSKLLSLIQLPLSCPQELKRK